MGTKEPQYEKPVPSVTVSGNVTGIKMMRNIGKGESRSRLNISEKDFVKQVIQLAHLFKWRVAHFRAAMTRHGWRTAVQGDGAGFPDLCMVRDSNIIFAELKTGKGKVSEQQQEWLSALGQVASFLWVFEGFENVVRVYVWYPSDFDEIVEALK